ALRDAGEIIRLVRILADLIDRRHRHHRCRQPGRGVKDAAHLAGGDAKLMPAEAETAIGCRYPDGAETKIGAGFSPTLARPAGRRLIETAAGFFRRPVAREIAPQFGSEQLKLRLEPRFDVDRIR